MKPPLTDQYVEQPDRVHTIMEMLEVQRSLIRKFYTGWLPPETVSDYTLRLMRVENKFLRQQIDFLQQQILLLRNRPDKTALEL